jgi:hypothetical protein
LALCKGIEEKWSVTAAQTQKIYSQPDFTRSTHDPESEARRQSYLDLRPHRLLEQEDRVIYSIIRTEHTKWEDALIDFDWK